MRSFYSFLNVAKISKSTAVLVSISPSASPPSPACTFPSTSISPTHSASTFPPTSTLSSSKSTPTVSPFPSSPLASSSSSSTAAEVHVAPSAPASSAACNAANHHLLLRNRRENFIWDTQILDAAAADVALRDLPEAISIF